MRPWLARVDQFRPPIAPPDQDKIAPEKKKTHESVGALLNCGRGHGEINGAASGAGERSCVFAFHDVFERAEAEFHVGEDEACHASSRLKQQKEKKRKRSEGRTK